MVIFDCNGVLVDSEPLATAVVSQEFIRAGFALTPDIVSRYFTGRRQADMFAEVEIAAGRKLPKEDGIQRFKGLGEMPAKELWDTTMDPDHRVLLQVTLDDAAQADELFSVLMGEDVEARRHFIQRNAKDVRFLDI